MSRKVCLMLALFLLVGSPSPEARIVEGIVALVNEEVITLGELEEFLHSALMEREEIDVQDVRTRRQALDQLIEKKLLLKEAKDLEIEIRDEKIIRRWEEIKKQFPSEEIFFQALRQEGLSETKFKKKIEADLMVNVLVEREVKDKTWVEGEEVRRFFDENKERFLESAEVELGHIFIKIKEGQSRLEAGIEARKIARQLKNGADFSSLAKEYSDGTNARKGGRLGFLKLAELNPEFEQALSGLKIGETTALIKMEDGFHLLKLEGRKSPRQMELEEVRGRIEALLFARNAEARYRAYLAELKNKAYIEIK